MEPTLWRGFDGRQIREAQASRRKRWLQATWTCTWRKVPLAEEVNAAPVKGLLRLSECEESNIV